MILLLTINRIRKTHLRRVDLAGEMPEEDKGYTNHNDTSTNNTSYLLIINLSRNAHLGRVDCAGEKSEEDRGYTNHNDTNMNNKCY